MTIPLRSDDRNPVGYVDRHAARYDQHQYAPPRRTFITARDEQMQALVDERDVPEGGRALDAGCGPGNLMVHLASRGWRVCGLDRAPGMLWLAKSRLDAAGYDAGAEFADGSIEALLYQDAYLDLVGRAGVFEYRRAEVTAIREFAPVVDPGGTLAARLDAGGSSNRSVGSSS